MKEMLGQLEAQTAAMWSTSTTYHLEVKTTAGACNEACFVSQNQVDMVSLEDKVAFLPLDCFAEHRVDASS